MQSLSRNRRREKPCQKNIPRGKDEKVNKSHRDKKERTESIYESKRCSQSI